MDTKAIGAETLRIIEAGRYTAPSGRAVELSSAIAAAKAGTRCYDPAEVAALAAARPVPSPDAQPPKMEVTGETTQAAAARLMNTEGVTELMLLNYASARNVGGGFLGGARAQEEDLARASALYACLLEAPRYYDANRAQSSVLYTDHLIYSPRVPFFRAEGAALVERPCFPSVITAPAPNAGQHLAREPDGGRAIEECLRRRAGFVLDVARAHGHRTLLLGAWGCGVFQNDPEVVAQVFADALAAQRGAFERVVFAVYDRGPGQPNLSAFRARF
ncbi:MAG: TIGR02452 family protein [Myxococcota bacterium]